MSEGQGSRLAVTIDGAPLGDEEARALWREFSEHMDANRGDMAGFAKKKGFVSVSPEYLQGKAVLVAWTTAPPPRPPQPRAPKPLKPAQARPKGAKPAQAKASAKGKPGKPKR